MYGVRKYLGHSLSQTFKKAQFLKTQSKMYSLLKDSDSESMFTFVVYNSQ